MINEIEEIISSLRKEGISTKMCEMIRRNADAGALEYAKEIICGDKQDNVEEVLQ